MLASSKMLALSVEVEANSHTVGGNSESDVLSTNSPKCHTSSHSIHQTRNRNIHHHARGHGHRKTKSPDLIVLSDAGHSPVFVSCIITALVDVRFDVCCFLFAAGSRG